MASTLDGGRELLTYIHVSIRVISAQRNLSHFRPQWHPNKPIIASVSSQGNIFIWHCPTTERWGAFAGGFEEVDENVEYEEREDEFDIVSPARAILLHSG